MNKVLNKKKIIFIYFCYKSKKQDYQEEIKIKIIKIKKQEGTLNIDDDEKNVDKKIILLDDELNNKIN